MAVGGMATIMIPGKAYPLGAGSPGRSHHMGSPQSDTDLIAFLHRPDVNKLVILFSCCVSENQGM